MRDTTGCGEHFPENRTFEECRTTAYTELIKDKSTEEVQSMLDEISNRFQDSLSAPESDTTKLKQLEYFVRCLTRPVPNLEEKHTLVSVAFSFGSSLIVFFKTFFISFIDRYSDFCIL